MDLDAALPDVTEHVVGEQRKRGNEDEAPPDGQRQRRAQPARRQARRHVESEQVGGEGQAEEDEVRPDPPCLVALHGPHDDTGRENGPAQPEGQ